MQGTGKTQWCSVWPLALDVLGSQHQHTLLRYFVELTEAIPLLRHVHLRNSHGSGKQGTSQQ